MALCGLFAALTAICSYISIPLGFTPVPVNLGTLAVFLAGGLLGKKYGTVSLAVYAFLGAVGVPVFAGFRGGLSVLAGPTGGYIVGYIVAAFLIGLLLEKTLRPGQSRSRQIALCAAAEIIGLLACYALGTLWFIVSTGTGIWASLVACVFPFLPGDGLKIAAAAILIQKLRRLL
ncbi:MAG: biotin transporter BioY [Firmicutes bacterium]|nr:biotin transporter BioY [Bacillota bacterium]